MWKLQSDFVSFKPARESAQQDDKSHDCELHQLRFKKLVHVTHFEAAKKLYAEDCFRPKMKFLPTDAKDGLSIVWFHAVPECEDVDRMKENVRKEISKFMVDSLSSENENFNSLIEEFLSKEVLQKYDDEMKENAKNLILEFMMNLSLQSDEFKHLTKVLLHIKKRTNSFKIYQKIGSSPAFRQEESRYGNFHFSFEAHRLLKQYRKKYPKEKLKYYILGTFRYKWEVQHTVLIAPAESFSNDLKLEELSTKNSSHIVTDVNNLAWKDKFARWRLLSSTDRAAYVGQDKKVCGHLYYSDFDCDSQNWQCLSFGFWMKNSEEDSDEDTLAIEIPEPKIIAPGHPHIAAKKHGAKEYSREKAETEWKKWEANEFPRE
mmetsp:Transcript_27997/g.39083  ORF Transcript_27997/g.39083 Transcript_27997/m.39083 type:complete len:375 (-) Transcript_27997:379-1503(-)|eukprot:CAMPEP_0185252062 /NCGR_PEP_ID=MMETSP1359-20130426/1288_1 /TAXON_ID=552665 /ORGANISM="Bigelowiella longifila, Strain CCMP242" /LENGTH=374 /DNA_ID=CAMNT_0027834147 /DNA_START=104 /DNA_END=1228 /DNA_ORIENTATION=-